MLKDESRERGRRPIELVARVPSCKHASTHESSSTVRASHDMYCAFLEN